MPACRRARNLFEQRSCGEAVHAAIRSSDGAASLAQLAQFEANFWILRQIGLNQIKELSGRKRPFRRVVATKYLDVSR